GRPPSSSARCHAASGHPASISSMSWARSCSSRYARSGMSQWFSVRRVFREIWWYAAFLAVFSTPVALVMTYFSGSECSVEAYYSLHQLGGAESLAGVFNALCDMREITPLFFGFAIGAKVGCGLVAELGTMRINEEIDAL